MGCGIGVCHACTVILDHPDGRSEEWRTCITGAHFFAGKSVRTIEGHAQRNAQGEVVKLTPVQQAFIENFAFQCGYCILKSFVTGATTGTTRGAQWRQPVTPRQDLERVIHSALDRHICRCTSFTSATTKRFARSSYWRRRVW